MKEMLEITIVEWVDSCAVQGSWLRQDDIPNRPGRHVSIGFLVDENQDAVTISGHKTIEENPQFAGTLVIPRKAITSQKKRKL